MKQTMVTTLISLLALLSLSFFLCIGFSGGVSFYWETFLMLFKILGIVGTLALMSEYVLFTYKIEKK